MAQTQTKLHLDTRTWLDQVDRIGELRRVDGASWQEDIGRVTEIGFPSGEGHRRTDADLQRDLRTARDLVRDEKAAGLMLWPFQTDPKILVGDLFTK